ncbi:Flagellar basal body protein [Alphaproteobacteria bacterium]
MAVQGYTAALLGMKSAQQGIGDSTHNVANASTPGFRGFLTQYLDANRGSGVVAETGYDFNTKGAMLSTGKNINLAIDGKGAFIVKNSVTNEQRYTFNGGFDRDKDNNLTLNNRYTLLGWKYDASGTKVGGDLVPVQLIYDKGTPGVASTAINFGQINFGRDIIIESGIEARYNPRDNASNMAGGRVTPDAIREVFVNDSNGGKLHSIMFAFKKLSSKDWAMEVYMKNPKELATDSTGVGLLQASKLTFNTYAKLPATGITQFSVADLNTYTSTVVTIADPDAQLRQAVAGTPPGLNIANGDKITVAVTPSGGSAISTTFTYDDSKASDFRTLNELVNKINSDAALSPHVVASIVKNGSTYGLQILARAKATVAFSDKVGTEFSFGTATPVTALPMLQTGGSLAITWATSINAEPSNLKLTFDADNFYQMAEGTSVDIKAIDGQEAGSLKDISIDSKGILTGTYNNNKRLPLYKIPIAVFQGQLDPAGDNCYIPGAKTGSVIGVQAPGTGGAGTILSGYVEGANVDYQDELPKILEAQHKYKMSAKALQVNLSLNKTLEEAI